ncbi:hypothetical protein I6F07_17610 [Ensifer sp. IC4062]|nr:hypothetical protein [Ensifer sp. IC4062]MCA1441998.1 hypothetical protein [Ensifer sp. IC4062]
MSLARRVHRPHAGKGAGGSKDPLLSDACASLWTAGAVVHIDDLVLHGGLGHDMHTENELTIARDLLSTRRRIVCRRQLGR